MTSTVDQAVVALQAGELAIVPTDTVYGLVASADSEVSARKLSRAKGRDHDQPIALLAADLDVLLACVPELRGRAGAIAGALLPGPYTLVLPNPSRRYRWLTGSRPDTIGIRIPAFEGLGYELLGRVGALAGTSANLAGGPDPHTLEEVPVELRAAAGAVVDGGALLGTPSTVLDFTGAEPRVLRHGAGPVAEALRIVASVL